jgi:hypothetical protein
MRKALGACFTSALFLTFALEVTGSLPAYGENSRGSGRANGRIFGKEKKGFDRFYLAVPACRPWCGIVIYTVQD